MPDAPPKWFKPVDDEHADILCPDGERKARVTLISLDSVLALSQAMAGFDGVDHAKIEAGLDRLDRAFCQAVVAWSLVASETVEGVCQQGRSLPALHELSREERFKLWRQGVPWKYIDRLCEGVMELSGN